MFLVLSRAWDKEKILSPHEESNLRPSGYAPMLYHRATETPTLNSKHYFLTYPFFHLFWNNKSFVVELLDKLVLRKFY